MKRNEVLILLKKESEDGYKAFNEKIIPEVKNLLGVRMKPLRNIAKKIEKDNWQEYLKELHNVSLGNLYFEEIMLEALLIGKVQISLQEKLTRIEDFIPNINNWAVCDYFCAALKFAKEEKVLTWEFIGNFLKDHREYHVRFGIVMLLTYFIDDDHIEKDFYILERIVHKGYYVKMAVAWAISICYVKYPDITRIFFEKDDNLLDDFTYNKSIQKIKESYRVSKEDKEYLNSLKRKNRSL